MTVGILCNNDNKKVARVNRKSPVPNSRQFNTSNAKNPSPGGRKSNPHRTNRSEHFNNYLFISDTAPDSIALFTACISLSNCSRLLTSRSSSPRVSSLPNNHVSFIVRVSARISSAERTYMCMRPPPNGAAVSLGDQPIFLV